MKAMNIYMIGVGGQGIGLLSEVLVRASLKAGYKILGADTHGLAQRGGTVVSHLRLGEGIHTPRVPPGQADLVIAMERYEALRAAISMLKPGGDLLYYDAEFQPIYVRLGEDSYPTTEELAAEVQRLSAKLARVFVEDLPDPRMQNVALLARLASLELVKGVDRQNVEETIKEVVPARVLDANLMVFHSQQ